MIILILIMILITKIILNQFKKDWLKLFLTKTLQEDLKYFFQIIMLSLIKVNIIQVHHLKIN